MFRFIPKIPITEDQLPCEGYLVMNNYIIHAKLEVLPPPSKPGRHQRQGLAMATITEILWKYPRPRKQRQVGSILYGLLAKATKNRDEAISVLQKRAAMLSRELQAHTQLKTAEIQQYQGEYLHLSQQPSTWPCNCTTALLNQSGCQCGGI